MLLDLSELVRGLGGRIREGLIEDVGLRFMEMDVADAELGRISAELRTQLDDTTEENYRDFFLSAGKRTDLPKRVGYYVGFRVAKILAARRDDDLRALARLDGQELRSEIDAALASLR